MHEQFSPNFIHTASYIMIVKIYIYKILISNCHSNLQLTHILSPGSISVTNNIVCMLVYIELQCVLGVWFICLCIECSDNEELLFYQWKQQTGRLQGSVLFFFLVCPQLLLSSNWIYDNIFREDCCLDNVFCAYINIYVIHGIRHKSQ